MYWYIKLSECISSLSHYVVPVEYFHNILHPNVIPCLDSSSWLNQLPLPYCFYNSRASNDEEFINAQVDVFSDGTIISIVPGILTSICAFNYKNYPYDQHTCMLKFGSWVYDYKQVQGFISKAWQLSWWCVQKFLNFTIIWWTLQKTTPLKL